MGVINSERQISWEQDFAQRINPDLMNRLLYQAVPVLQWTRWRITQVARGYCESVLPLSVETTNQHGTHQAALISLSADYTGGMAVTTLLTGTPLKGIHRCHPDQSASLWLVSMEVRYEMPSTSHLRATCRINEKTAERIQTRYFSGRIVLVTLDVEFWSEDGDRVAVAKMKYFAQATRKLLQQQSDGEASTLAKLNLKTSARIIAGLRAQRTLATHRINHGSATRHLRIDAPHDRIAAGTHGTLQAGRLQKVLPQLASMVAARTAHCDDLLREAIGIEQLVLLGSGLDMRPLRLAEHLRGATVFELDLPVMLQERQRVIDRLRREVGDGLRQVERHPIPADFLNDDVGALLRDHFAFSDTALTLVIYEGCSMYFDESQNVRTLRSISRRLRHPASRVWMDCVTPAVIDATTSDPNIHRFVEQMELIGERFVFGPADPESFLARCGFVCAAETTAGEYLGDRDPTLAEYRFLVGQRDVLNLEE
jgi:methyltransferase (TIGR00027 family)